ncbi:TadE/TadG family type IV pilus assembly protein [Aquisalinus flavus]|uniref:TadE-like domain-containing protein n=1 Tax=Aquisalinus flavus TaxID=1526572 RepID=A0A8J2V6A6_9PROT|nr:TadE/TadG family type IV pilus assembly protein [Aquisalinus flavus]MBD0427594.1 pilus assembly protein [Aquisalinus flavus]UNE47384.1 pilus assembly protein [Aquisalinus flavus]GGD02235.1 hypothetical protein GCM10011342_09080 [Aquisalinus flavus]
MRILSDSRGASAVEFAMTAPLLIFFMMAIIDLGRFAMLADSIETAVLQGARTAMVASDASESPATVQSISAAVRDSTRVADEDALVVSVNWQNNSNSVGSVVTVSASYEFDYMTPEFFMSLAPQTVTKSQSLTIVN